MCNNFSLFFLTRSNSCCLMENRVKELQRHVSEMTDEIRKINALLKDFTNCKSCIRKLYKAPPDRVNSPVFTVPPVPVAEEHRDTPPRSIITSISTLQKPQASTPKTSSINEDKAPPKLMLLGSPSRGVYIYIYI